MPMPYNSLADQEPKVLKFQSRNWRDVFLAHAGISAGALGELSDSGEKLTLSTPLEKNTFPSGVTSHQRPSICWVWK